MWNRGGRRACRRRGWRRRRSPGGGSSLSGHQRLIDLHQKIHRVWRQAAAHDDRPDRLIRARDELGIDCSGCRRRRGWRRRSGRWRMTRGRRCSARLRTLRPLLHAARLRRKGHVDRVKRPARAFNAAPPFGSSGTRERQLGDARSRARAASRSRRPSLPERASPLSGSARESMRGALSPSAPRGRAPRAPFRFRARIWRTSSTPRTSGRRESRTSRRSPLPSQAMAFSRGCRRASEDDTSRIRESRKRGRSRG